jgi:hypothetical protein
LGVVVELDGDDDVGRPRALEDRREVVARQQERDVVAAPPERLREGRGDVGESSGLDVGVGFGGDEEDAHRRSP